MTGVNGRRQEQDRMALIAFADGVQVRVGLRTIRFRRVKWAFCSFQQVTLPSYEEALRDSSTNGVASVQQVMRETNLQRLIVNRPLS